MTGSTERYAAYRRLQFDWPHPRVLRVTMANGRMNTADALMHDELGRVWRDVDADPQVNAVIITGAGRFFSAGGDFSLVQAQIDGYEARVPVISAMRGVAVGAGLVCGLLADVSLATKDCRILDGHTRLGVAAGDHAAMIWPLLCGMARAKYYLMTCDTLLGAEAERIGLITEALDDDALDDRAVAIAVRLAEGAQTAIRWTKYSLNNWLRQAGPAFDASLALEFMGFDGPEVREGLRSHQEKRKPAFDPNSPI